MLKDNPNGIHPSTLAFETKITQYGARIMELRNKFGCSCRNGSEDTCTASEHIVNRVQDDGTTKFFYRNCTMENYRLQALKKINNEGKPSHVTNHDESLF